ncbi:hypothetical protein AB0J55_38610 [Amycolatopsis sp. NPDC049688]|uniref:hypothetical protein n=1 Tax=Amycolatopsis sp. NPDC049688 TaxID=3154733 RepID=UPI003433DE15
MRRRLQSTIDALDGGAMNHDRSGRTRNEVTGPVSGVVVQAGYVAGDIHIHQAPGATEASAARTLWADFERKGEPYYPTFVRLMANHGHLPAADVAQLARQVLELAMLGSEGDTQDRALLSGLARPLGEKADELIDAASRYVRLLLEFAEDQSRPLTDCNAAGTDVLNAYLDLVIAGMDEGRAPSWFSLDDFRRRGR